MAKAELPKDRKGKADLVKALLKGDKRLEDLEEDRIDIVLNLHPTPEQRAAFNANRLKQEDWRGDPSQIHFTVDVK